MRVRIQYEFETAGDDKDAIIDSAIAQAEAFFGERPGDLVLTVQEGVGGDRYFATGHATQSLSILNPEF